MRKAVLLLLLALLSLTPTAPAAIEQSLQERINQASAGDVLRLEPGTYTGNFVIDKPLTLDGGGKKAILDGGGKGTILTLKADGVILRGLVFQNTGDSHDQIDAAVKVKGFSNHLIENNLFQNCLFGIELRESHKNKIYSNEITSKSGTIGLKGDALRAYASHHNHIKGNYIHHARDMVIWYSDYNVIEENIGHDNRYSVHFMYTGYNEIRKNKFTKNAVGIFLMYGDGAVIEDNEISHSIGATGVGIGMKEVSQVRAVRNKIVYCSTAVYLDQSPFDPSFYNLFEANLFASNTKGVVFHSSLVNNIFQGNSFIGNLTSVKIRDNGTALGSRFKGNYWGDYKGFDLNRDDYGDVKHQMKLYFGQLWQDVPFMQFYFASTLDELMNFVARIAPLTEPRLIAEDTHPVFKNDPKVLLSASNLSFKMPELDVEGNEEQVWQPTANTSDTGEN